MIDVRTKGETYEALAFTWCKAATIILITGQWALPVAALATAFIYVLAYVNGKKDTRCVLRFPLLIAAFWGVIGAVALYYKLHARV